MFSAGYKLLKSEADCRSRDESLGDFPSIDECADACRNKDGCAFFLYGIPETDKELGCFWEKTPNEKCSDGWQDDKYNFYELRSTCRFSNC